MDVCTGLGNTSMCSSAVTAKRAAFKKLPRKTFSWFLEEVRTIVFDMHCWIRNQGQDYYSIRTCIEVLDRDRGSQPRAANWNIWYWVNGMWWRKKTKRWVMHFHRWTTLYHSLLYCRNGRRTIYSDARTDSRWWSMGMVLVARQSKSLLTQKTWTSKWLRPLQPERIQNSETKSRGSMPLKIHENYAWYFDSL